MIQGEISDMRGLHYTAVGITELTDHNDPVIAFAMLFGGRTKETCSSLQFPPLCTLLAGKIRNLKANKFTKVVKANVNLILL